MEKTSIIVLIFPGIFAFYMGYLALTDYDCEMHGLKHEMGTIYKTGNNSGALNWGTKFTSRCTRKHCHYKAERYLDEMDALKPEDWLPGIKQDYSSENSIALYHEDGSITYTRPEANFRWPILVLVSVLFLFLIGLPITAFKLGWLDD